MLIIFIFYKDTHTKFKLTILIQLIVTEIDLGNLHTI
jgi:hypothetical protein